MLTISLKIEHIIFPRKGQEPLDSGFVIASAMSHEYKDTFNIKGNIPGAHNGMEISATGDWKTDKYGKTFCVTSYEEPEADSVEGIRNYLSSGLIEGIGEGLADAILSVFGANTLKILDHQPEQLKLVHGIGPKKLKTIMESWEKQKGIREVMVFLKTYKVGNALAAKIFKKYGNESIAVIKENPYKLADDITGVGFLTVDTLAVNMGMPLDSNDRIRSCILYTLDDTAATKGHVFLFREELIKAVQEYINAKGTAIADSAIDHVIRLMTDTQELFTEGEDRIYLPIYYHCEKYVAKKALELVGTPELFSVDFDAIEKKCGLTYDDTQKEAINLAASSHLCIITGGPGTGKTTTMKGVIQHALQMNQQIILAAPTGRASKRLSETTGLPAQTIHRLLEYKPGEGFGANEDNPLTGDLLVVDESSMIDLLLMNSLLKAVPETMKVVFVGDVDQLPSVGAGNVLRDLIDSEAIPVVRLTKIFRQAQDSLIVKNAHAINKGYAPSLPGNLSPDGEDFCFIHRENTADIQNDIINIVADYLPNHLNYRSDDIQLLSPMRKGPLGTMEINKLLQERLNPGSERIFHNGMEFRKGDKIIQIKNNYEADVFNGDIGKIISVDTANKSLVTDFDGKTVEISGAGLDNIDLAYCTTIHKSQGSEYPVVLVPVSMSHYIMLMRNLLYTAVTRAKKRCILIGEQRAVMTMINNNAVKKRNSLLKERLKGVS